MADPGRRKDWNTMRRLAKARGFKYALQLTGPTVIGGRTSLYRTKNQVKSMAKNQTHKKIYKL